jgi:hypothetical protein
LAELLAATVENEFAGNKLWFFNFISFIVLLRCSLEWQAPIAVSLLALATFQICRFLGIKPTKTMSGTQKCSQIGRRKCERAETQTDNKHNEPNKQKTSKKGEERKREKVRRRERESERERERER